MPIEINEIAKFLGDTAIFERARRYQAEGRVQFLSVSFSFIEAEVLGSGENVYQTAVTYLDGVLQSVCSCPYPLRCKHVGAVLLEALSAGEIPSHWRLSEAGEPETEIRQLSEQLMVEIEEGVVTLSSRVEQYAEEPTYRDRLRLGFFDNDRSTDRLDALTDRCLELLQPFTPVRSADGELFCDASLPEILERVAEPMLEAGAWLTVAGRPVRIGRVDFALRVVSSGERWFSVTPMVSLDGETLEFAGNEPFLRTADGSVVVARNRDELVRLKQRFGVGSDGTVRIEEGDLSRSADLEELIQEDAGDSSEATRRAAELIRRARERRDAWRRLASRRNELDREEPPGFRATLRGYQRYGFAWLEEVTGEGFGPLLADDMGLGKTVQALALLQSAIADWVESAASAESSKPPVFLVIAPPATIENWRHETWAFAPALTPIVYHGSSRAALIDGITSGVHDDELRTDGAPLLITSYQTLLKDVELLSAVEWDHLIFDEIQQIKNLRTKSYRAARVLSARRRLALSGTPVENSSLELYAIVDLLNPGILGSRGSFLRRFGVPIEQDGDEEARSRLRELLTPLVLRRRKAEVATELPSRDEIPLYLSLPQFQRRVYEKLRSHYESRIRTALQGGRAGERLMLILEGLTRLRQAAVDPRLLPSLSPQSSGASVVGSPRIAGQGSAKLTALGALIPQIVAEGHRVLVFSQFVSLLSILREWAERQGYAHCYLDGSMTPARRKREISRFQEPGGPPIFFISLRAGGVGINLTAADYVILMDPWWNPAVEDQAIDRSHRIGQTRPVTAYRLIAAGTVEERIAALQSRKRALAGDLIPDESAIISTLSEEEVLDLFSVD